MEFNLAIFELAILTLINAFSVFLIVTVIANSFKDKLYRWFAIMTFFLIGWVDSAYLGFSQPSLAIAEMAYRVNGVFVVGFIFTAYVFYIETFLNFKNKYIKALIFIISCIFAFLSIFTDNVILDITSRSWGNEIVFGELIQLFNFYTGLFSISLLIFFIFKYFNLETKEKRKVLFFLIGTLSIIILNVIFNILTPVIFKTAKYQHFGDYSAVIFLAFTAFAIIKHKFLNVRIAVTSFIIGLIGILLIVDILALSENIIHQLIKSVIFILFAGLSILLVRSVLTEIRQREELSKINKALDKSKKRYINLANEQKDIIDVMGHEIRTPLTAIVQELNIQKNLVIPEMDELLEKKLTESERLQKLNLIFESFETIDKASSHAVHLVTHMLETARLDKKRFEINYSVFDVVEVINTSIKVMSKTTDLKNLEINFINNLKKSYEIKADKVRIREALDALINNAIKYRDLKKDKTIINVTLSENNGFVHIDVKDNGIGIATEDINKLGKKFVRLNSKSSTSLKRPGGTGLGLFVVKGIMKHHKGKLEISSEGIRKGSTFSMIFPSKV